MPSPTAFEVVSGEVSCTAAMVVGGEGGGEGGRGGCDVIFNITDGG